MISKVWTKRIPIYVRLAGGLGNQLSSLALAITVARTTGRKIFIDGKSAGSPTNSTSKDQRILKHVRPKNLSYSYFEKVDYRFIFMLLPIKMWAKFTSRNTVGLRDLHGSEGSLNADSKELNGFIAEHYEGISRVQNVNADEFDFLPFSEQFHQLIASADKAKPIAVHIRLGDFRTWHSGSFVLPPEYYAEALEYLRKKGLKGPVWVFTDENDLEPAYVSVLEGPLLIQDISDFEQLCLMARCNGIIASKSSFSWWACNWSVFPENVIFPIQNWMNQKWIRRI